MALQAVLKEQVHSGLKMLDDCVQLCPPALWAAPNLPILTGGSTWSGVDRSFSRIAFHAAYYTHLYLGQAEADFLAARRRVGPA